MADKNESPVQIDHREEQVQGQPQAAPRKADDGKTKVTETVVKTDKVVLDPNGPLAVQVPEGVGASSVESVTALGRRFESEEPREAPKPEAKPEPKK